MRETKKPLLLHPLSRGSEFFRDGLGEIRETGWRERANSARFEKRLKKFLDETEKALHLQSVSARKEIRRKPKVL